MCCEGTDDGSASKHIKTLHLNKRCQHPYKARTQTRHHFSRQRLRIDRNLSAAGFPSAACMKRKGTNAQVLRHLVSEGQQVSGQRQLHIDAQFPKTIPAAPGLQRISLSAWEIRPRTFWPTARPQLRHRDHLAKLGQGVGNGHNLGASQQVACYILQPSSAQP